MYKTFLSWRYMRARRTNLIGVIGIGVGVGALIMILSIMTGFLEETKKSLRGGLADIIVETSQLTMRDGTKPSASPKAILDLVRADKRVAAACAELQWGGMFGLGGRDAAVTRDVLADPSAFSMTVVRLYGIDAHDELQTTDLRRALSKPDGNKRAYNRIDLPPPDLENPFALPDNYVPEGRPLAGCIVGAQLAREWHLKRGSVVWITTGVPDLRTGEMHPSDRRFVVCGTFHSGENEMDLQRIYVDRAELTDFLSTGVEYNQVLVKLKDYKKDGIATRDDLSRQLTDKRLIESGNQVRTWEDYRRSLLGAIENERVLMAIMLSLVVVVAGFTVFAILSMMVTEKRRDIGILSALGATPGGVTMLFVLIGFWDTLLGATGGALLGTWLAIKIDPLERFLSDTFGVQIFNRDVYLFDHIPAIVNPLWVAMIVLCTFIVALIFALMPAWKAGRLHPLDALRYE
jgi:lipoprotein-releasing system permease protein